MPLPKPKLLAGWRRAKLIALINESYLSFRVAAPVGLWSTRLRCPQIHRLDLFVTRWPSTCDAQRNQNSEPKFRPPAVSKSLTRSTPPMTAKYHINLFWSEPDGAWVADAPDLQSCSALATAPPKRHRSAAAELT